MGLRIGIRADGGVRVGFGHLGRCLALAQAFEALGEKAVFLNVPREARPWLAQRGGQIGPSSGRFDLIVADSYRFTQTDLGRLRRSARVLAAIDDLGTLSGDFDWILNGHFYAQSIPFRAGRAGLLLGPKFLPMRREYWKAAKPRPVAPEVRRIVVTLGGGASAALLRRVAEIASRVFPRADVLTASGLPSLRPAFESADLCVCAGGQTMYEAIFCGLPTIALELAPNQHGNVSSASFHGAIRAITNARPQKLAIQLARSLKSLASVGSRRRLRNSGLGLLDGRGGLRAAKILLSEARA